MDRPPDQLETRMRANLDKFAEFIKAIDVTNE